MKPKDFSKAIADALEKYEQYTENDVNDAVKEVSKEACEIVRNEAKKHYPASYVADIKVANDNDKRRKITKYVTAGDHYRVAHLLEHGHALVKGGRTIGKVKGHDHFGIGEKFIDSELEQRIKRKVESQ